MLFAISLLVLKFCLKELLLVLNVDAVHSNNGLVMGAAVVVVVSYTVIVLVIDFLDFCYFLR